MKVIKSRVLFFKTQTKRMKEKNKNKNKPLSFTPCSNSAMYCLTSLEKRIKHQSQEMITEECFPHSTNLLTAAAVLLAKGISDRHRATLLASDMTSNRSSCRLACVMNPRDALFCWFRKFSFWVLSVEGKRSHWPSEGGERGGGHAFSHTLAKCFGTFRLERAFHFYLIIDNISDHNNYSTWHAEIQMRGTDRNWR